MENYPNITKQQFTVQFLDRNTGIVLNLDFKYDRSNMKLNVYSIHNTLKKALEYAKDRIATLPQGNNSVGYFIRDNDEKVIIHTDNLTKDYIGERKTIILDGNNFSDTNGFYNEIDKIMTSELKWDTGHNLNALNDILYGGFGSYEYKEPLQIVWYNSAKSKTDLAELFDGKTLYQAIREIINEQKHIEFIEN
ncbi:Barstar (barnase inhibitor) [compost metagenome]